MNKSGLFCFALVLAFITLELSFLASWENSRQKLLEEKAVAFEAEKLSTTRSLLEESVDKALEQSLTEGLLLNLEPEKIRENANRKLLLLFRETEKEYNGNITVSFQGSVDQEFLNRNSSVLVTRIGKKTVSAEYSFTGGLLNSEEVKALVKGKNAELEFRVPAGYKAKASVVG